jgi:deglycase
LTGETLQGMKSPFSVDGNLITSRRPDDIPAFSREMIKLLASARGQRRAA